MRSSLTRSSISISPEEIGLYVYGGEFNPHIELYHILEKDRYLITYSVHSKFVIGSLPQYQDLVVREILVALKFLRNS